MDEKFIDPLGRSNPVAALGATRARCTPRLWAGSALTRRSFEWIFCVRIVLRQAVSNLTLDKLILQEAAGQNSKPRASPHVGF